MADEWGPDDDLVLEATLRIEDPNGPAAFVLRYLTDFAADRDVAGVLDPNYTSNYSLNLSDLLGQGWGTSGKERTIDGDQVVLYVDGIREVTIVRAPTAMHQVQFVVRQTTEGWRLVGIFEHSPS